MADREGALSTIVRDGQPSDGYVDKLAKILPAELTATYFLIRTLAGQNPELTVYLLLMALVLCVVFYIVAPRLMNMHLPMNRLLYCITFVTWFLAIDPNRFATDLFLVSNAHIEIFVFLTSAVAAIWSFTVPHLLR